MSTATATEATTNEAPPVDAMTEENAEAWADAGGPVDGEPEGGDTTTPPASESASSEEAESQAEGTEQEATEADPFAEPPEFWSAERKALWNKDMPAELRQAIHEQSREAARAANEKMMKSAEEAKASRAELEKFAQERDQLAQWWQQTGPRLQQAFANKWANIDWVKMAEDDPALYAKMSAQRDAEANVLRETEARHQQEVTSANQRAQRQFESLKRDEHTKLATKLPDYFGEGKAQATYDRLGTYLTNAGFDAQRVQAIYEAPVIEIAHKAMLYDEAQAKAKQALAPKPQPTTATQTSRRVVPGARPAGQPTKNDTVRQAEQRLRSGQDLSDSDVEALFG